ncbi:glycoside hydrolase family 130 protein [Aspergillus thermomutatus]|uniref:Glycosyl hydrolase family 32 N-terminal domain-containing protein n=1 Tax=Aspergillus thermomutatus TaxID=41047 RepID=A0A397HTQ3_ASPTH|nr:uncharacterized protein CDV56_109220 [Aspergillus thermomutatus]RHZ64956.1 hypothetical protein CDV56_109220 [Aspergillus thermomutatus]
MPPSSAYSSTPPVITPASREGDANYTPPSFPIGPFTKYAGNPVLVPNAQHEFESAYIYNAAALVLDDTVFLLYRAQNAAKVSTIGLAWSTDGYNFTRLDRPVLEPSEPWEAGGGVEDPRVVRIDGVFYMTYTAWDLHKPRLCLATSTDLVHWEKQGGPLFPDFVDVECTPEGRTQIRKGHTKSGAVFPERNADGLYMMIFGDAFLCVAESDDLIHWRARPFNEHFATGVHPWENRLLEPGPTPIKTRDGRWILVYNVATTGAPGYRNNQYSISQMLVDHNRLREGPLARLDRPSLVVSAENERSGQVNEVVFCEGMVQFQGRWFMYYGQGDSELGVATADVR